LGLRKSCSLTDAFWIRARVDFDAWHSLINKPENEVTEEEKALLDEVAEMTNHVDSNFNGLRELYQTTSYGQTVQSRLSFLGF
jgi:hypothetical protein